MDFIPSSLQKKQAPLNEKSNVPALFPSTATRPSFHSYNITSPRPPNHCKLSRPTTPADLSSPFQPSMKPRFNARRVMESLTSRMAKFLCSIFLTLLLIAGIIVFILWLSLRPHRPRFYLSSFSFPGLSPSSTISLNVTDRNPNGDIAIAYGAMNGTVLYNERVVAAGPLMLPFYQPPKNTTLVAGQLAAGVLPPADPAWKLLAADAAAGRAALRLELTSVIQFRVRTWDTHHHLLHVSCDLAVGPDGNLLPEFNDTRCSIYFG